MTPTAAPDDHPYLLGTDDAELRRLRFQHEVWSAHAWRLFERAGFAAGMTVLDLGCGPGFTSLAIAHAVGPHGRVLARDRSARYISHLTAEARRRDLPQVHAEVGDAEALELEPDSLDAAYCRWLLCWLPDPGAAIARVARALRPGGTFAVQEYLHWAAMRLLAPEPSAFDRAVAACMEGWRQGGATIDVGRDVPALAVAAGLVVERVEPVVRAGRPGSPVWRWPTGFLAVHLPRMVEQGLLTEAELRAHRDLIARCEAEHRDRAALLTPVMVDIVLRKP